jgi:hypothetical protein
VTSYDILPQHLQLRETVKEWHKSQGSYFQASTWKF